MAWLGAGTGTLALLWDVVKWSREGAQLRLELRGGVVRRDGIVRPGQQTKGQVGREDVFIRVSVANNGSKPTTIMNLTAHHYSGVVARMLDRSKIGGIVAPMALNGGVAPLPHLLGPGEQWTVLVEQKDVEAWLGKGGLVTCGIRHSAARRGVYKRIRLSIADDPA